MTVNSLMVHTNIGEHKIITFGVKGLLQANKSLKNALLFNILSYMSNELLTSGYTVASIDELYLFLTNMTAVEYIRNFMKRVRKKESAVILASQNLEDFNIEGIRELTKPYSLYQVMLSYSMQEIRIKDFILMHFSWKKVNMILSNILKEVCVYINAGMKDTTWLFVLQNIRLHSLEVLVEDKVEEPKIWY